VTARPLDPDRLAAAFSLVADEARTGDGSYGALAVGRRDATLRSAAFHGSEDLTPAPRSAIASVTKPITATAVLQLVETGRLDLDEPLAAHIPEFRPPLPDGRQPDVAITPRHVLTHTAGLGTTPDGYLLTHPLTRASMVERLCRAPLEFAPGTAYAYTTDSYQLLAELVVRLSGESWPDYLRKHVLLPLGMVSTTFHPDDPGPPALPLEGWLGPPGVPAALLRQGFISLEMPGGGLWSTPDDLVRFGRAMLNGGSLEGGRVLGPRMVEAMTAEHTMGVQERGTGRRPGYGLGWSRPGLNPDSAASPSAFGHSGATGSMLIVDPDNDLVVVHLRNVWLISSAATEATVHAVYGALV
jgi:CubicO group peptidase (beta-lactamase class C family)